MERREPSREKDKGRGSQEYDGDDDQRRRRRQGGRKDEDERGIRCDECGKTYGRSDHLKRHKREKHAIGRELIRCPRCPITTTGTFANNWTLSRHIKNRHPEVGGEASAATWVCPTCGVQVRATGRWDHQNGHKSRAAFSREIRPLEGPFFCDLCSRPFVTLLGLTNHLKRCTEIAAIAEAVVAPAHEEQQARGQQQQQQRRRRDGEGRPEGEGGDAGPDARVVLCPADDDSNDPWSSIAEAAVVESRRWDETSMGESQEINIFSLPPEDEDALPGVDEMMYGYVVEVGYDDDQLLAAMNENNDQHDDAAVIVVVVPPPVLQETDGPGNDDMDENGDHHRVPEIIPGQAEILALGDGAVLGHQEEEITSSSSLPPE